jgi:hypothetical protein
LWQRNVSLFSGELDNDNYDALLSVDEKERLAIFNKVCFHRQPLAKIFPLGCSNAYCTLLFYQDKYFSINVAVFSKPLRLGNLRKFVFRNILTGISMGFILVLL